MAQSLVTQDNNVEFITTGKVPEYKPEGEKPEPEAKVDDKDEPEAADTAERDEYGLTEADRKVLGQKRTRMIGRKHAEMMAAKEAAAEAEAFAKLQYSERKAAEERAAEFEAKLKSLEPKVAQPEAKEPKREDFDNDADYWDAKIDWKAKEAVRKDREARAAEDAQRQNEAAKAAFIERRDAFAKTVPDWEEKTASLNEWDDSMPAHLGQYLFESETGPKMLYHFADHPEEFKRIAALSPIKAIAEMGKLEVKLERAVTTEKPADKPAEKVAAPKVTPKAPEPITPLEGNTGVVHKDLRDMNAQETIEYWRERDQARATRRQRH